MIGQRDLLGTGGFVALIEGTTSRPSRQGERHIMRCCEGTRTVSLDVLSKHNHPSCREGLFRQITGSYDPGWLISMGKSMRKNEWFGNTRSANSHMRLHWYIYVCNIYIYIYNVWVSFLELGIRDDQAHSRLVRHQDHVGSIASLYLIALAGIRLSHAITDATAQFFQDALC